VPQADLGSPGDVYIREDAQHLELYAKVSSNEWHRWPGPSAVVASWNSLQHPHFSDRYLWCTLACQKRSVRWYSRDSLRSDVSAFTRGRSRRKNSSESVASHEDRIALPSSSDAIAAALDRKRQVYTSNITQEGQSNKRAKRAMQDDANVPHALEGSAQRHGPLGIAAVAITSHDRSVSSSTVHVGDAINTSCLTRTHVPYATLPVDCCIAAKVDVEFPRHAEMIKWNFNGLVTVLPFSCHPDDVSDHTGSVKRQSHFLSSPSISRELSIWPMGMMQRHLQEVTMRKDLPSSAYHQLTVLLDSSNRRVVGTDWTLSTAFVIRLPAMFLCW
jgi:hypothetical protein